MEHIKLYQIHRYLGQSGNDRGGRKIPAVFLIYLGYSENACNRKELVGTQLANSLEYPQRIEIEWSQCLNSLSVLCLLVSKFSQFLYYKVL